MNETKIYIVYKNQYWFNGQGDVICANMHSIARQTHSHTHSKGERDREIENVPNICLWDHNSDMVFVSLCKNHFFYISKTIRAKPKRCLTFLPISKHFNGRNEEKKDNIVIILILICSLAVQMGTQKTIQEIQPAQRSPFIDLHLTDFGCVAASARADYQSIWIRGIAWDEQKTILRFLSNASICWAFLLTEIICLFFFFVFVRFMAMKPISCRLICNFKYQSPKKKIKSPCFYFSSGFFSRLQFSSSFNSMCCE